MKTENMLRFAAAVAVGACLVAVGCSSDDSSNPTPHNSGGSSGKGGSGGSSGKGGTGGANTGGSGGSNTGGTAGSSTGGSGGGNTGGAAGSANCVPDGSACYSCPATTTEQFLNHCTNATCTAFDNSKLTQLAADGGLPPLP